MSPGGRREAVKLHGNLVLQKPERQSLPKRIVITHDHNVAVPAGCNGFMPVRVHRLVKKMCVSPDHSKLAHGRMVLYIYGIPAGVDDAPSLAIRWRIAPPQDSPAPGD